MDELRAIGALADEDIDPARAAIHIAALDHPGIVTDRYFNHLNMLADDVAAAHADLLNDGQADGSEARLAALKAVLHDQHGYRGDVQDYNDLQNADLIRVIDRRRGMPISLALLYISTARMLGWAAHGLNVPGHFLARLDYEGARLIFDPFDSCHVMNAPDLRRLVKTVGGPEAELSASYYEPASNRDMLVRLQNNRKIRLIEAEEYESALSVVMALRAVAPDEYRLLLDEGVLCARTQRNQQAITALEAYIQKAPGAKDRHDAALLLNEIKHNLH